MVSRDRHMKSIFVELHERMEKMSLDDRVFRQSVEISNSNSNKLQILSQNKERLDSCASDQL